MAIVCNEIFTKYCSKERIYYLLFSQFILILNLTNYYCKLHLLKSIVTRYYGAIKITYEKRTFFRDSTYESQTSNRRV